MSATKHTQGPWVANDSRLPVIFSGNEPVAACVENVRILANARLIAAAPDMAEALQRIASGKFDYNEAAEYRAYARAALAKAGL